MQVSASRVFELPLLWYRLATDYQYVLLSDWQQHDRKLVTFEPLRITHVNENLQVSKNLPRTFVSLNSTKLTDKVLEAHISAQLKGRRVPLVTYCVEHVSAKELFNLRHAGGMRSVSHAFLLRSPTLNNEVTKIMQDAFRTLRVIDLQASLPTLADLEAASIKLREATYINVEGGHFINLIGKWSKIVRKVLVKAQEVRCMTE